MERYEHELAALLDKWGRALTSDELIAGLERALLRTKEEADS
jgi:hypothetical protein